MNWSTPNRPLTVQRIAITATITLLILLASAASAYAIPLQEYGERINHADSLLKRLLEDPGDITADERRAQLTKLVAEVRAALPVTLSVDWNGTSVNVDNEWLHKALGQIERLDVTEEQRAEEIVSVKERLTAIEARLHEPASGGPANTAFDKDLARGKLAEIKRREAYNKPEQKKSLVSKIYEYIVAWLEELIRRILRLLPKGSAPGGSVNPRTVKVVEYAVLILALGAIGFALWKFVLSRLFGNSATQARQEKGKARVVLGEEIAAEQGAVDLLREAEALARAGDARGAIRKGYIALLCELSDRKVVGLAQHKTNRDYLADVIGRRSLLEKMQILTLAFERHWYGFIPATDADWTAFRSVYSSALRDQ